MEREKEDWDEGEEGIEWERRTGMRVGERKKASWWRIGIMEEERGVEEKRKEGERVSKLFAYAGCKKKGE